MKSIARKFITAGAALTIGLAGIASAQTTLEDIQERGYIQIATANEVPYGYVNAAGEAEGIAPDVATAVLNNLGIDDVQWVVTQFGSLIPGLMADRFDMVAAEQPILPDRCAQVLFFESDEVCEVSYKDRGGKYQGQSGVTLPKA